MHSKRNIYLLCAVALLQGMVFYAPIASLYRQHAGLTLAQISLIEAISYIISLAAELPWGILADKIGHRRTMIAGCGIYFISKIIFWRANSFSAFLLERFALSMAISALSGVEESMLYLSCDDQNSRRIFGLHGACGTAGLLLAAAVQALIFGENHRAAALATMVCYGLALLLALGLHETGSPREKAQNSGKGFLNLLRQMLSDRRFLAFLVGFALLRECVQMITVWLNQNQYLRCGMSQSAMGLAYMLVSLAAMLGAFSGKISRRLGDRRFTGICCIAAAVACILLVFVRSGMVSILCIAAVSASGALLMPMVSETCSRRAKGANMATAMSCFALVQSLSGAIATAVCGSIADLSLNAALFTCAAMCLLGFAGIIMMQRTA